MKEQVFHILSVYLENRLFNIEQLISDAISVRKYTLFMGNKKKVQTSFISSNHNTSSPFRQDYTMSKKDLSKSVAYSDLRIDKQFSKPKKGKSGNNSFV